jgi:hypothetical protein
MEVKEDKHFNSLSCSFIATGIMHHSELVLNAGYSPTAGI